jgi:antirestriction protein ArdC
MRDWRGVVRTLPIATAPRADHASYIESWLKVLKNDKRAIFTAAAHAERAAAFLHGLQPERIAANDDEEREAAA